MLRLIALLAAASLVAGCATCERHETACTDVVAIGAVLAAGAIAASTDHGASSSGLSRTIGAPGCAANPVSCH